MKTISTSLFRVFASLTPVVLTGFACAQTAPGNFPPATQMVVVTTSGWNAVDGRMQRFERASAHKKWKPVGDSYAVVVGKSGLAWGAGIIPVAPADPADPVKKEGDGRAPAGVFRLSTAFGYAPQEQSGWKMPYVSLTQSVECVDDSNSKFYNRVVDHGTVSADWNSSEHMLRPDELYRWGIVVDHNSGPARPGGGSCIFLHIWRGAGIGTVGCTAMPRERVEALLSWLDPAHEPLLVQMPASEYKRLRKPWHLPALPEK
jgi:D-alanyl-D-alanine dipeptidase